MPVIFIWTLKLVMPTSVGDTVRVRVAAVDALAWRSVLCGFHVTVIGPFALAGLQPLVVMFSDSERPVLVFLT